jgi:hypothetical protein
MLIHSCIDDNIYLVYNIFVATLFVRIFQIAIYSFLAVSLAACSAAPPLEPDSHLNLARFTENNVSVEVTLSMDGNGQVWLDATYTPQDAGFHLYSQSLPRNGLNGQGRPTLLEIPAGSPISLAGKLRESVESEVSSLGPNGLLVYPAGPVTLSLPISLPPGKAWIDTPVSITYEACSDLTCLTPVVGRLVLIRIPSVDLLGD